MDDFGPGLIVVLVVLQIIGGLFASKKKKEAAQKAKQAEKNNSTHSNPQNIENGEGQNPDPFETFIEGMTQTLQPENNNSARPIVNSYSENENTNLFENIELADSDDAFMPESSYKTKSTAQYISRPLKRDSDHIYEKLSTPNKLKEAFILFEIIGKPKALRK
ncbi:MAG: hypothetical protein OCD01_03190 [Fibrobacterales bacterium]